MSDEEGSVLFSGHFGLEVSGFLPQSPWQGDGGASHGEVSTLSSRLVGLEYRDSLPRGSARGCFGEFEKALVHRGFLESSCAGHKPNVVFGDSLRCPGPTELSEEDPGVLGGRLKGSGQGCVVIACGVVFKRLSSPRDHCSLRSDREGSFAGHDGLSLRLIATDNGIPGKVVLGGVVPAKN